jgi:hypothetical protein
MILACRVLRSSVGPGKLQVTACGRDFRHSHACTGHAMVSNVSGVMATSDQERADSWREVLIDQEPHAGGLSG